jgi:hypothetical protein
MPLTTVFIPPTLDGISSTQAQAVEMVYFSESGFVPSREVRHARVEGVSQPVAPVVTKADSPAGMVPHCSASQVFQLQSQGFVAMQVTVPPLFSQRGKLYSQLQLPKPFKVLSVVREGEVLPTSLEAQFVKAGDAVFILSQKPDAIRSQFFS